MTNPKIHFTFISEVIRSKPRLKPQLTLNQILLKDNRRGNSSSSTDYLFTCFQLKLRYFFKTNSELINMEKEKQNKMALKK